MGRSLLVEIVWSSIIWEVSFVHLLMYRTRITLEIFSDQQAVFVHEWPLDLFECPFFVSPQAEIASSCIFS